MNIAEPSSLKQICRSAIRERKRKIAKDTNFFDTLRFQRNLKIAENSMISSTLTTHISILEQIVRNPI